MNSYLAKILSTAIPTLVILTLLAVFFKLFGPLPFNVSQTTTNKMSTFDVMGEGRAEAIPDQAQATFGITSSGSTVASVQQNVNTVINQVKTSLKEDGVEEKDIKTTGYTINPEYDYSVGKPRITGYNATSTVEVTFRDFEKLNSAFDRATASGANIQGNLVFGLSDKLKEEATNKAREMAIQKAKEKAKVIADQSGLRLGKLINVTETQGPQYYNPMISARDVAVENEQKTEVSPGVSDVKMNVILSFETN